MNGEFQTLLGFVARLHFAVSAPLVLSSSEMAPCSHAVHQKLLRHGRCEGMDGFPAGTVHGNEVGRRDGAHRRNRLSDDGFKHGTRHVETAHDGVYRVDTRHLPGVVDGIDDAGVRATADNDQPLSPDVKHEGLVVVEGIGVPRVVLVDLGPGKASFKIRDTFDVPQGQQPVRAPERWPWPREDIGTGLSQRDCIQARELLLRSLSREVETPFAIRSGMRDKVDRPTDLAQKIHESANVIHMTVAQKDALDPVQRHLENVHVVQERHGTQAGVEEDRMPFPAALDLDEQGQAMLRHGIVLPGEDRSSHDRMRFQQEMIQGIVDDRCYGHAVGIK